MGNSRTDKIYFMVIEVTIEILEEGLGSKGILI